MSKKDPYKIIPPRGLPEALIHPSKTLNDEIKKWRKTHPDWTMIKRDAELKISAEAPPIMMCSAEVKEIFQNSDYDKIKQLQKKFKKDFEAIDKSIRDQGTEIFRVITNAGPNCPKYFVAYDPDSSIWIYCHKTDQEHFANESGEPATKVTSVCQLGRYSVTTGIVGTIDYTFKYTTTSAILDSCILAGKVVEMMLAAWKKYPTTDLVLQCFVDNIIVDSGDSSALTSIAKQMSNCWQLGCLTSCLLSLSMAGLAYLWKWTWKKYCVKFCIFNWSPEHDLFISDSYQKNAEIERIELKINNPSEIRIPKASPVPVLPPNFKALTPIDSACHYDMIFVANKKDFIAGCGFAYKVELDQRGSKKGFLYAFECTRLKLNRQKASENLNDYENLEQYYEKLDNWNENPLKFSIQTEGIPVSISVDALCCSNNFFPIVNFNSTKVKDKSEQSPVQEESQKSETIEKDNQPLLAISNNKKYGTVSSSTENLIDNSESDNSESTLSS